MVYSSTFGTSHDRYVLSTKHNQYQPNVKPHLKTTAHKKMSSITDFFNKCDQIRSFLRIWSHLLKKSLMENFIFCAVDVFSGYRNGTLAWNELNKVPTNNYLFKFNNRNTRNKCDVCSVLTIKTTYFTFFSSLPSVDFEQLNFHWG